MMTSQQSHNVNSSNGTTTDCDINEAQTLADTICDFNETLKTEENFTNPWQQSCDTHEEDKEDCNDGMEEPFKDKEQHKQHAQQHTLEKGLQMCRKRGKDATLKEIGQPHNRACFEPMRVEDMTETLIPQHIKHMPK